MKNGPYAGGWSSWMLRHRQLLSRRRQSRIEGGARRCGCSALHVRLTGLPKGVWIARGIASRLGWYWARVPVRSDARCCASTRRVRGLIEGNPGPPPAGGPLVLIPESNRRGPILRSWLDCGTSASRGLPSCPSLLAALLDAWDHFEDGPQDTPATALWRRAARTGTCAAVLRKAADARLINVYGARRPRATHRFQVPPSWFKPYRTMGRPGGPSPRPHP